MAQVRDLPPGYGAVFAPRRADAFATDAIDRNDFTEYQISIIHAWLHTITVLALFLVPLFFLLDTLIVPPDLLPLFAVYRGASTALVGIQHLLIRSTRPRRSSFLHGYFVSLQVGGVIALMTVHLGGFESGYYAGLIMVIIGVNLLMPWRASHTAANAGLIVAMYVGFNILHGNALNRISVTNNLFFLLGVSVISVAINHVRYRLIQTEFSLLVQLKRARDSLWSEMELAKQVQVSLLPVKHDIPGYRIAVSLNPAREVGGDYYDVIEDSGGSHFVTIGDVAGHGLDSGLIMMMAQTAVMTVVKGTPGCDPADVVRAANAVLRENVGRLGSNHYMTMTVLRVGGEHLDVAGHHQDILVYRASTRHIEVVATTGTWLGIADDIDRFVSTTRIPIGPGDRVVLFSDGVTEAENADGRMFGQDRLNELVVGTAHLGVEQALASMLRTVEEFRIRQDDDLTLILLERRSG